MDDMERYGDYNEIDERPGKSPVLSFIKIVAVVLIFTIIGFVGFRIFTFNYYPENMQSLHYSPALEELYIKNGGNITVFTQKLAAKYDDNKEGNFFVDHLRFSPEAGTLQLTVRYNTSLYSDLKRQYKAEIGDGDRDLFDFTLYLADLGITTGRVASVEWDEFLMYRYVKIVFEDVDFDSVFPMGVDADNDTKNTNPPRWVRLEIKIDGVQETDEKTKEKYDKIFRVLVLENQEKLTSIREYEPSSNEVPR